jgi:hypothetical protein
MDPEKREDWEYQMNAPIPGREAAPVSEGLAEIEGQGFMSMMSQHRQLSGKGA